MSTALHEDEGLEALGGREGVGDAIDAARAPVDPHPAGSPISNAALERAAADVADFWRVVQKRAPREVNRRVRLVLESVYRVCNAPGDSRGERLKLGRELEAIAAELRGRRAFVPQFYRDGRLAVVWAWDPIKIRGAVDHRRIDVQFERYVRRADLALERLNYFLERVGIDTGPKVEKKPWDKAYGAFEEFRELLWGRVRQDVP